MTNLTLKRQPEAPLEAACITPDNVAGKTAAAIAALSVMHGNEPAVLGDFFRIEGNGTHDLVLCGDLGRVKNVAAGMTAGSVAIRGAAGMHLGAGMRGGTIDVEGNAGDWAGAEMRGGRIRIRGNAGHGLGGAYRGSRHGMNRGLILVEGSAGNETGAGMRRGCIAVRGDAGDFAGAFMIAGTILVFGEMGIRAGAGLLRGTLVAFHPPELLPTFRLDCRCRPGFLPLVFRELEREGFAVPAPCAAGSFLRYSGDRNRLGKGEILVYDQR